ncbi:endonuclease/exonuclease/phosphatase family protein [Antarcticibacterium sp. 1MA-6-2]|uniref:endonuclease/exonuclease/phosphatase family protein n=1 Tax=Antarcticibacterium sp. 1MA-6-2 TaxID=2908210 RepID=UPI001F412042|nr:endonuclease/exonuclease/phosphatase family protein [Antarcticibacterium sp. 1MA-6-2]UJH92455.1 endonuclease/exonuclease/phosphatase family protein [Antarcticibacterium sp. 1MA-6-2]
MKRPNSILLYLLIGLSTCIVILSLLSLIHDLKFWYFKILDFPRLQYLLFAVIFLILFLIINKKWKFSSAFLVLGLLASIFIQGKVILPYYIGSKTVPDAGNGASNKGRSVGILIANVLITNRNSEKYIDIVREANPDMVLAMEVNKWWVEQLQVFKNEFPYTMILPLDNAYGMALYSKYPLKNQEVMFLNKDNVPSFYAEVLLKSGESFSFFGVHPVAPVPSGKYPDNQGEKEVALLKVGEMVVNQKLPVVVAGDFNDVSWSHTSRLFEGTGALKNVRIGRGLYNTFDANSSFLRWPLDHFFVT